VNQSIYDNADAGTGCGVSHDAFDLFGPGGTSTAPDIFTARGWEDHTSNPVGTTIFLHGQVPPSGTACPAANSNQANAVPPLCPEINQPIYADPFAPAPAPALGLPAWGSGTGLPMNITKINRTTNVATAVTSTNHNLAVGDKVTVSGVGSGFDGAQTVTGVPNPTTFTYANTGSNLPVITQKQMTGGVATLTTNAPSTLSTSPPDDHVTVSGIDNAFNATNAAVTGSGVSSFSYQPPAYRVNVTNKALSGGTATLKVNTTAALAAGDTVTVAGVDPLLDGSFVVASIAGGPWITYADPATQTLAVVSRAIATGTTATITTAATHTFATGDHVTVNTGDARFDGSFTAINGSGAGVLKYTIPAVTANITNASVAGGAFTLTTASGPPIENGDTVAVSTGLLAYDGSGAASLVNTGAHTFVYAPGMFQNSSWTFSAANHTVTLTTASAHGLVTGNVITATAFGGAQACMNVANASVTVGSPTTFTYSVPAACNPGASGNQKGTITLVTAASHAVSGTVTLTTMPALAGSGTVTAPAFIASTAVVPTCNNCVTLTDVPATADSGTFTPAWMPTLGVVAKSFPGSPGNPAPFTVPAGSATTTINQGTYYGGICIGLPAGTACNDANCAAALTAQSYSGTAPTLSAAITAAQTTFNVTQQKISVNDVINIGNEDMLVTAVTPIGVTGQTLTVNRGYMASTAVASASGGSAAHASGATIKKVVGPAATTVNLNPGTYIMAGGGFFVCGSANLSAPQVMIYNTADPTVGTGAGALAQISLFTLGSVNLGPPLTGLYEGLTIFQDHQHEFDAADSCNTKSTAGSSTWDVALVAMASTGANGSLGSVSGSIYAHDSTNTPNRDDFGDEVSGTTTMAVMTDCIFIDGANSTFNFATSTHPLFGLSATLSG
jgi:hypothetical protein